MFVLRSTHLKEKQELMNQLFAEAYDNAILREALEAIIANATAKPNATVARMVKIAEETLRHTERK